VTARHPIKGFTLIELIIVVSVIGIIAMIGYPSYLDHIRKSRRSDAESALFEIAQRQERFYAQNATYTTDLENDLGYSVDGDGYHVVGSNAFYRANMLAPDANCPIPTCFRVEAIPNGGQVNDRIQQFVLWSTGQKQKLVDGALSTGWKL